MTRFRLNLCCDKQEEQLVKRLAGMTESELVGFWQKFNKNYRKSNYGRKRKVLFISLELMDRGFKKTETWEKKK